MASKDIDGLMAELGLDDAPIMGPSGTTSATIADKQASGQEPKGDTPPEGAEPTEASTPAAEPTPEQIASWMAKADHKALSQVPAYNQQIQRAQAKLRKDLEAESQARSAEAKLVGEWDTWFQSLTADEFRQAMEDPQRQKAYEIVRNYKQTAQTSGPNAAAIAAKIVEGLQKSLQERPEFADLKWDELLALDDPGEFLQNVIDHGVSKAQRKIEASIEKEVEARVQDRLAKHNLSTPEPEGAPGDQAGGATTSDAFLRDFAAGKNNDFKRVLDALGPDLYRRGR